MEKPKSILFLTLRVFSATGGIEKVCRVAGKALYEIAQQENCTVSVFSMYDQDGEAIEKYFPSTIFKGFDKKKLRFVQYCTSHAKQYDTVILSHINLLSVGVLMKIINPSIRLILIAHGIEVWKRFPYVKKWMLGRCNLILPVSEYTRNYLLRDNMLKPDAVTVLNNCLDPFLPAKPAVSKNEMLLKRYGFDASNKIILTLTRISSKERYKGYDNVLYAIKRLYDTDPDIRYLIVGKYDMVEKRRIDSIIHTLEISDRVVFAGFIPDEEIADHFSLADIYVMPSKKEGFGIVFIEAMYYGLPVIAGNKDGSVDALDKGNFGLLVDPDNRDMITAAISTMFKNTALYKPDHAALMKKFSFDTYKHHLQQILNNR